MNNIVNTVAYLRTSREFPEDNHNLTVELSKSYIEIAQAVNARTIGLFPTTRPALTGESWFLIANQRQQTFRQVYAFGAIAPGTNIQIAYGITSLVQFTRIYGTCITSTDYLPIPYVSVDRVTDQVAVRINKASGNIVVANGATNSAIVSGLVVLEWLVNV